MGIDISDIRKSNTKESKDKNPNADSWINALNKDISWSKGLSDKKKYRLYSEISLLIIAGVDIRMAIELSLEGEKHKKTKVILQDLLDNIVNGSTLSESMQKTGNFTDYEFFSIKIGEESGNINEVLKDLASFYEDKIEFKRKLVSTFSYPLIVLSTALTAVFFMLNFIVPIFEDAFKRFGGDLPYLTQVVLSLSDGIQENGLLAIFIVLSLVIVIWSQRKQWWFRKYASLLLLKTPVIGSIAQKNYLARFCHSMALLTGVENPLVNSINLVRKMVSFYPLEKALEEIEQGIIRGNLFHKTLAEHDIFPLKMVSLIKVGEEVNKLSEVFMQLHKQYASETENSSKTIGSLMEPILIIFIGLFVGIILIAMYLPLFEIGSGMQ